jgi:hypothetical protein
MASANQKADLFNDVPTAAPNIRNAMLAESGRQNAPVTNPSASRNRGSRNAQTNKNIPADHSTTLEIRETRMLLKGPNELFGSGESLSLKPVSVVDNSSLII